MIRKMNSARASGFTLIELLVVIAIIAILAAILLPLLARAHRKGLRVQDIDNMREASQGSILYAGDFQDWFPILSLGAADPAGGGGGAVKSVNGHVVNCIDGYHYTRYIAITPEWNGAENLVNSQQLFPGDHNYYQNLGLLYAEGDVQNPHSFFCPLLTDPALNESQYQSPHFLSTAAAPDAAVCRSPYIFNPRLTPTGSGNNPFPGNPPRKYNKTSDVRQLDVFMLDYILASASAVDGGTGAAGLQFNSNDWAQYPSKGIEAAFTDGSVRYVNLNVVAVGTTTWMQLVLQNLGNTSYLGYDQLLTFIQYAR